MVRALSREVATERAARDLLQQTVDAWELHEEQETGEAAGDAGVSAHAPSTPAPLTQPQRFTVSPGAADTEWGSSPMPAGHAAAQGWSAHAWTEDANWQDPWTWTADPWASGNAGWQKHGGHGWWGYVAPPTPPPGVAPADADAQDDRLLREAEGLLGGWSWPAQSQDWHRPHSPYGWPATAKASGRDSWGPKHTLDRKDLDKPEKYTGDITKWVHWAGTFKRFLRRHDPLWPQILEKIEAKKGLAISKEVEDQMANEFWWVDMRAFKDQLFQCLECYTTGEAKKCVTAADESNVFSTWSRMADKGHSLRDDHVMDMQRKAYASKSPVAAKDLELAISVWEKEVSQFEEASGNTMEPKMRTILLTDMCPLPLRQRIKDFGPERFSSYEAIRAEALNWLADNLHQPKGKLAVIIDVAEPEVPEIAYEQLGEYLLNPANADVPPETLLAMVRNAHLKKTKGGGKGDGKARPPRRCFECDAEDHIGANCPIRAARVAAGGPERLDDPMGLGKAKGKGKKGKVDKGGGKGGKGGTWTASGDHGGYWVPTRAQIKGSGGFPFPTQHQYTHAWHNDGKGAQPGAKLMTGAGAEAAEDWSWMRTSGYAMSLQQVPARAAVTTSNAFTALTSEEPDSPESIGSQDPVLCAVPPEPVASTPLRAGRSATLLGASRRCCRPTSCQCRHGSGSETMQILGTSRKCCAETSVEQVAVHTDEAKHAETSQPHRPYRPKLSVKAFLEKRAQSLRPLATGWEKLQAILDSGASVTVVPPHVGRDYEVIRGEAAMAGVRYEIADGNEIPNLGEKMLPVMTREGTWRGLQAEVADIARALQSVRSLVKTGHKVVFGDGANGTEHYIQNVMTGEVNAVEDDGQNYLMTYLIAPKDVSASFAGPTN